MPTFRVIVTRDITESAVVEVKAAAEGQAEAAALDTFFDGSELKWKKDDGLSDPYVTGIDLITD
ncbi:MAG: hypothetical protein A3G18_09690 [Rhodospirillales bacterium RIFCSPLOWO2_12_FULL_58_28]|nr:MAG: hypothetical protein A3H92_06220 [Rhodospirillales bacterium RIFCSPLOWO2_02_FULL_58_16]OHC78772.1 MAG: hypothetical protein A3G18_09690 [Rhodospirillales bacterium RIFCSPLOWO2_12_FULL_58_28]